MINVEQIVPALGSQFVSYQCHNSYNGRIIDYNCLYTQIPKTSVHQNIIMQTMCNYGFRLTDRNININKTQKTRLIQNIRGVGVSLHMLPNGRTWE